MEKIKVGGERFPLLRIAVMGVLAGVANGLLGAGGGILVVFGLSGLMKQYEPRDLYASALCVMLPVSVISCIRYAAEGNLSVDGFGIYALPAIAGGILGGILLGRLGGSVLKKLFGSLVIYSGILLILR
ncbi:MAG: TSUP family transporter [Clostridia bacterium]|nr:TSUP family transporter [Clostridia bacterium]